MLVPTHVVPHCCFFPRGLPTGFPCTMGACHACCHASDRGAASCCCSTMPTACCCSPRACGLTWQHRHALQHRCQQAAGEGPGAGSSSGRVGQQTLVQRLKGTAHGVGAASVASQKCVFAAWGAFGWCAAQTAAPTMQNGQLGILSSTQPPQPHLATGWRSSIAAAHPLAMRLQRGLAQLGSALVAHNDLPSHAALIALQLCSSKPASRAVLAR